MSKKQLSYVTRAIATEMDNKLFNKYKLKVEIAMELAGQGVAYSIHHMNINIFKNINTKILFLIGPGNNGGDGLVAARHLASINPGYHCDVVITKPHSDEHKKDLLNILQGYNNIKTHNIDEISEELFNNKLEHGLIVDCLFGFSFSGPIRKNLEATFDYLKSHQHKVVSIDVPSGWEVDNGNIYNTFVPVANISLGSLKTCIKDFDGIHYFVDHFMPRRLLEEFNVTNPDYTDHSLLFTRLN